MSESVALQDKLMKHQQEADFVTSQARLSELDNQAQATEKRILILKRSLLQNDKTIQNLLLMSVGAV